jgi:hypothetical protein
VETRGIAPLIAVIVVVAALGSATAVPVAVSVANVDPDHPLYPLKRVGETIRAMTPADRMKVRWQEYQKMVTKGKGLQYQGVLKDFASDLNSAAPAGTVREDVLRWIQEHRCEIGEVQLRLAEQAAASNPQLLAEVREWMARWRENCDLELLRAWLSDLRERLALENFRRADGLFDNACVLALVQENLRQAENVLYARYTELQREYDELRAEVEGLLASAPSLPGKVAAQRLHDLAVQEASLASQAYQQGQLGKAVGMMTAAVVHLRVAKSIMEHAQEWEPEHAFQWQSWRQTVGLPTRP